MVPARYNPLPPPYPYTDTTRTTKIDFEAVARETGYTNPRSAANRLSAIKKTASTGVTCGSDEKPVVAATATTKNGKITKRRPRKNSKALSKKVEEVAGSVKDEEMGDSEEESKGGK